MQWESVRVRLRRVHDLLLTPISDWDARNANTHAEYAKKPRPDFPDHRLRICLETNERASDRPRVLGRRATRHGDVLSRPGRVPPRPWRIRQHCASGSGGGNRGSLAGRKRNKEAVVCCLQKRRKLETSSDLSLSLETHKNANRWNSVQPEESADRFVLRSSNCLSVSLNRFKSPKNSSL